MASDSQARGRAGEVITRTWQTAHKMKVQRGALPGDPAGHDNGRIKRYVAKYTICPAVAHGVGTLIGSVEVGKLADLTLWHPAFFGVHPQLVLKGGFIAFAAMGDANASIPTPQPVWGRPMFGAHGAARASTCLTFLSSAAIETVAGGGLPALRRRLEPVRDTRSLSKRDLPLNDALPVMEVDADSYNVRADGELLVCEPLAAVPLAQRYFMF